MMDFLLERHAEMFTEEMVRANLFPNNSVADVRRSEWIKSVVVLVIDGRMMGAQELT